MECSQLSTCTQEGYAESFVVWRRAAGIMKGALPYAQSFQKGDHTLCERAICATWGFEILM